MKLSELLKGLDAAILSGEASLEVHSIVCDSRKAAPGGCVFVAIKGCSANGADYVADALSRGASAAVETDRKGLALIADRFYGHPSGKINLVGITGTNGKTTTVTLLYNLFRRLGYECGLLSTIANYVGAERFEAPNTTMDPITVNDLLSRMVQKGCEYCFMEASSIGIEQDRVTGLEFKVGIFSNLTHDHLDYHKTFAEYLRCKKLFFDALPASATALINIDDRNGMIMVQNCAAKLVTYSCRAAADHCARILEQGVEGMTLRIDGTEVCTRLVGAHNAYNLLAIYSTALALGADRDEVLLALSTLGPAPGRFENITGPGSKTVIIDYAHTPDALENVLKTIRELECEGDVICVFGCGGDRDATKRPEMAAIAEKYSDRIIVTEDNSRTEDPEAIFADIRKGFSPVGAARALFIADRTQAIRTAIALASPGSTILLAGKGHEDYLIRGTVKSRFVEKEIVEETFKSLC